MRGSKLVFDINVLLSKKLIAELKNILMEDYGRVLSEKELYEFGQLLLNYFDLLAKIYYREQTKEIKSGIKINAA